MTDTKTKILDLAETLTQQRGFSGFSYLDIAEHIGIKTASIHYHFKSKDDLAVALVERTHEMHMQAFHDLDTNINSPEERLAALIEYFKDYARNEKFCLCGMMAAELYSVSPKVTMLLNNAFAHFENWLVKQFKERGHVNAKASALTFLCALEGALLIARLREDPDIIHEALESLL